MIGRLIDEIAEIHSVAVVYLRADDETPMEEALAVRCAVVEEVRRPKTLLRYLTLMGAWAGGRPMWVEDWRVPAFRVRLHQLAERWRPDVMQFEFHTMAQYADKAKDCPAVLVEHDPGTTAARDRWRLSSGWRTPILGRDFRAWETYERAILKKFQAVVCFTDKDRGELLTLAPDARIYVIPPVASALTRSEAPGAVQANTILFVGNFVHPPNVEAALRLAGAILPRVRARHPDAVLQLVGDGPPAAVRRLAGPGVISSPDGVPDRLDVPRRGGGGGFCAAMWTGGGIRIKVMDALAYGKPLVATPLAAEGMNLIDRRHLLLAQTDEGVRRIIVSIVSVILSNASLRESLSANALRACAVRFGARGRVGAAFDRLYRLLKLTNARTANQ